MIGAIGSKTLIDVILFEMSPDKILTLQNFTRQNGVRFAKHDTLLKKPISQYIGQDLDNISFDNTLRADLGVNPKNEFNKLIRLQRDGETLSIVLGKRAFGIYRWRITNLNILEERINNEGICTKAVVNIRFEEYAR